MIIRGVKKLGINYSTTLQIIGMYMFLSWCVPMVIALDFPIDHVLWVAQLYNKQHGIFITLDMNR